MKLKEAFEKSIQFLKDKGLPSARLDVEILFSHILKAKRIELYMRYDSPLSEVEVQNLRAAVVRRAQHEPVAYITGEKDFFRSTFQVGPGVLVPRPETEILVEEVCQWLDENLQSSSSVDEDRRVVGIDLGSGSGCIAISIEQHLQQQDIQSEIFAIEKSKEAFQYLQKNIELHKSEVKAQMTDVHDSTISFKNHHFKFVVANPPYIDPQDLAVENAVKKYEPSSALFAEDQGLAYLKSWSALFASRLDRSAIMIFEIGHTQGEQAQQIFKNLNCFSEVSIVKDLAGHDRFVKGVKHG